MLFSLPCSLLCFSLLLQAKCSFHSPVLSPVLLSAPSGQILFSLSCSYFCVASCSFRPNAFLTLLFLFLCCFLLLQAKCSSHSPVLSPVLLCSFRPIALLTPLFLKLSVCVVRLALETEFHILVNQQLYILHGFKTSDDAFRLSYSIAFDCSIRPFLDLFHSWLFIFHLSRFSGDGLVFSFLRVSSES
jgi:hypothetical protein